MDQNTISTKNLEHEALMMPPTLVPTTDDAYELLTSCENWEAPLAGMDEEQRKRMCVAICMAIDALHEQTTEGLNTALYKRMFAAQEDYKNNLCCMAANEILDNAYDYVKREDILASLEHNELEAEYTVILLQLADPLSTIYDWYENHHKENDTGSDIDRAWYAVTGCAECLRQKMEEQK